MRPQSRDFVAPVLGALAGAAIACALVLPAMWSRLDDHHQLHEAYRAYSAGLEAIIEERQLCPR